MINHPPPTPKGVDSFRFLSELASGNEKTHIDFIEEWFTRCAMVLNCLITTAKGNDEMKALVQSMYERAKVLITDVIKLREMMKKRD